MCNIYIFKNVKILQKWTNFFVGTSIFVLCDEVNKDTVATKYIPIKYKQKLVLISIYFTSRSLEKSLCASRIWNANWELFPPCLSKHAFLAFFLSFCFLIKKLLDFVPMKLCNIHVIITLSIIFDFNWICFSNTRNWGKILKTVSTKFLALDSRSLKCCFKSSLVCVVGYYH